MNLTPGDVRNALVNTATDMLPAGFDYYTGAGLTMADAALASVEAVRKLPNAVQDWGALPVRLGSVVPGGLQG